MDIIEYPWSQDSILKAYGLLLVYIFVPNNSGYVLKSQQIPVISLSLKLYLYLDFFF